MIVGIHQPQYMPWLPYMEKIESSDAFVLLDSVQFHRNGLQNRNQIKGPTGPMWLTVPVKHQLGQLITAVKINNAVDWRRKHWNSLLMHYGRAPWFDSLAPLLASVYSSEWELLIDLNLRTLSIILTGLGITTPLLRSSQLPVSGIGSELILNICKHLGASVYVSGTGAKAYLDEDSFSDARIEIVYQPAKALVPYPQRYPAAGFAKDLSALDVLLNCGPGWRQYRVASTSPRDVIASPRASG